MRRKRFDNIHKKGGNRGIDYTAFESHFRYRFHKNQRNKGGNGVTISLLFGQRGGTEDDDGFIFGEQVNDLTLT